MIFKTQLEIKVQMTEFFVIFTSVALDSPKEIGPFYSKDEAYDCADRGNISLGLGGIPSDVACYSVL